MGDDEKEAVRFIADFYHIPKKYVKRAWRESDDGITIGEIATIALNYEEADNDD